MVHTISRRVWRAWLCGNHLYSGKNLTHRRVRAKVLVNHFALSVFANAVMSKD